ASDPDIPAYGLTASGRTMQLLGDAMQGMSAAKQLSFQGATSSLVGWLFADSTSSKRRAILVNSSASSVNWPVDQNISAGQYVQLSCSQPFKIIVGDSDIKKGTGQIAAQLTLPAYSITELKNQ